MKVRLKNGMKLYAHQEKTIDFYLKKQKAGNFSEMGTGKTLPTAIAVSALLSSGAVTKYLIIVPKILLQDWKRVFTGMIECEHEVCIHHGPDRGGVELARAPIVVTTYQTFVRDVELFKLMLSGKHRYGMVVDEVQGIRNLRSKQSQAIRQFAYTAEWVQLMSGNPAPNGLEDYFPALSILTPLTYLTENAFLKKHCIREYGGFVVDYKNTKVLADVIAGVSVRYLKRECLDLPPSTFDIVELEMSNEQLSLYTKMTEDMFLELPDGKVLEVFDALPMLTRSRQVASNPALLGFDAPSPKFELFEEDINNYPKDKKIVVFCEFIGTGYKLKEIAEKNGRKVARLFDTTTVNVDQEKERFKSDPATTMVIANPKSAGVGVDFSVSSFNIFVEYSHDLNFYSQAIERSSRPGLKENLTLRHYCMSGTVEPKILAALQAKQNLVHTILRDPVKFRQFLKYEEKLTFSSF